MSGISTGSRDVELVAIRKRFSAPSRLAEYRDLGPMPVAVLYATDEESIRIESMRRTSSCTLIEPHDGHKRDVRRNRKGQLKQSPGFLVSLSLPEKLRSAISVEQSDE